MGPDACHNEIAHPPPLYSPVAFGFTRDTGKVSIEEEEEHKHEPNIYQNVSWPGFEICILRGSKRRIGSRAEQQQSRDIETRSEVQTGVGYAA